MKTLVVDASVAVGLFFEEPHSRAIERCFKRSQNLLAPDLIWAEIASVIWKRHRRGELSQEDAMAIATEVSRLPLQSYDARDLMADALRLALQFDRSVYDCLYLAVAIRTKSVMITADKLLVNALSETPLAKYVIWIGTIR